MIMTLLYLSFIVEYILTVSCTLQNSTGDPLPLPPGWWIVNFYSFYNFYSYIHIIYNIFSLADSEESGLFFFYFLDLFSKASNTKLWKHLIIHKLCYWRSLLKIGKVKVITLQKCSPAVFLWYQYNFCTRLRLSSFEILQSFYCTVMYQYIL